MQSRKFKAVISTLNSQYIHSSLAPWCLLAGVSKYCGDGVEAVVVEGTVNENIRNVYERITAEKPDAIGFCTYIWNVRQTFSLIKMIKKDYPGIKIIVGGPEVGYRAENILESTDTDIDFVSSGEGEYPFAMLVNSLQRGSEEFDIPGICYKTSCGTVIKEPYISAEDPPSPYTDDYFRSLNGRIAYLESTRGCPFSCAFCLSGRCGAARSFDLDKTKENIIKHSKSGAETIKFVDRTFNADKKRAAEILEFIKENYGAEIPDGVCFHFEIAGDILNDNLIRLFGEMPSGSVQLEIGLQSFNEKTLKAVHRKTDTDVLKKNIRALLKPRNIHIHIDLIAGLPFEDYKSFVSSFNEAFSLRPDMLQLGFLKLIYGSLMREDREQYPCNFSADAPYEVIDTPWITNEELSKLHFAESALDRLYNSGRFRKTLEFILETAKISPYELFYSFGKFASDKGEAGKSLDGYTNLLYDFFKASCGEMPLRDVMTEDRLASNSSGIIPSALRVFDGNLKKIKLKLDENPETKAKSGVKRTISILYSKEKIIYADYEQSGKNRVTGLYDIHELDYNALIDT